MTYRPKMRQLEDALSVGDITVRLKIDYHPGGKMIGLRAVDFGQIDPEFSRISIRSSCSCFTVLGGSGDIPLFCGTRAVVTWLEQMIPTGVPATQVADFCTSFVDRALEELLCQREEANEAETR